MPRLRQSRFLLGSLFTACAASTASLAWSQQTLPSIVVLPISQSSDTTSVSRDGCRIEYEAIPNSSEPRYRMKLLVPASVQEIEIVPQADTRRTLQMPDNDGDRSTPDRTREPNYGTVNQHGAREAGQQFHRNPFFSNLREQRQPSDTELPVRRTMMMAAPMIQSEPINGLAKVINSPRDLMTNDKNRRPALSVDADRALSTASSTGEMRTLSVDTSLKPQVDEFFQGLPSRDAATSPPITRMDSIDSEKRYSVTTAGPIVARSRTINCGATEVIHESSKTVRSKLPSLAPIKKYAKSNDPAIGDRYLR